MNNNMAYIITVYDIMTSLILNVCVHSTPTLIAHTSSIVYINKHALMYVLYGAHSLPIALYKILRVGSYDHVITRQMWCDRASVGAQVL